MTTAWVKLNVPHLHIRYQIVDWREDTNYRLDLDTAILGNWKFTVLELMIGRLA